MINKSSSILYQDSPVNTEKPIYGVSRISLKVLVYIDILKKPIIGNNTVNIYNEYAIFNIHLGLKVF